MKRMNEEYERLKKVVPMEQLNSEDGKDKKVIFYKNWLSALSSEQNRDFRIHVQLGLEILKIPSTGSQKFKFFTRKVLRYN